MKSFEFSDRRVRNTWIVAISLFIITIGIIIGCGKLKDDERPSSPAGTSGGLPIPIGPQSSLGTYKLSLDVSPSTVPADGINFATLKAQLEDSSGRSVENFLITFNASPTSDAIGVFLPSGSTTFSTMITARTSENGKVSVRLYGVRSGSCIVQASVDLDGDGPGDLFVTTTVIFTSSGPPSSAGNYLLTLTAEPDTIPADAVSYSLITAKLTDSGGGPVENLTISFNTGDLGTFEGDLTTYIGTTNSDGEVFVRFFGHQPGYALIQASVYVSDLVGTLTKTVGITITEGPGVPGTGVAGVYLSADQTTQTINAGVCGECGELTYTLGADVWDDRGFKVGAGVRVEFYNGTNLIGYANTTADGKATVKVTHTACPAAPPASPSWTATITAKVIISNKEYTADITLYGTITCSQPTPTPTPTPTLDVITDAPVVSLTGAGGLPTTATITACATSGGAPQNGLTVFYAIAGTGAAIGDLSVPTDQTTAAAPAGCTNGITYTPAAASSGATITITGSTTDGRTDAVSIAVNP
jgi:hypothetical protein